MGNGYRKLDGKFKEAFFSASVLILLKGVCLNETFLQTAGILRQTCQLGWPSTVYSFL